MPLYQDIKHGLQHPRARTIPWQRHRRRWTFYTPEEQHETATEYAGQMERFLEDVLHSYSYPALALAIDTTMDLGWPLVRRCLEAPPGEDNWDEVRSWIETQIEQLGELEFTIDASPWRAGEILDWIDTATLMNPWPTAFAHLCYPILDAITFAYSALLKWDNGLARKDIAYDLRVMVVSMAEAVAFEEIRESAAPLRPVPSYPSAQEFIQNWFDLYISRFAVRPAPDEDEEPL